MAESPAHKLGQVIGNLLEGVILPVLQDFCEKHELYLDKQGNRGKARAGKKVTWEDKYGNFHDLDFVVEREGTSDKKGRPLAFIEVAWRRYTKHSKNKAQEIQGAVLPIAELYQWEKPFLGAIVAGEFTQPSLDQLNSVGFKVLYFPYDSIVEAFKSLEIEVAFNESTPDHLFENCIKKIEQLSDTDRDQLKAILKKINATAIEKFIGLLAATIERAIIYVKVLPLYGHEKGFGTAQEAIEYLNNEDTENREKIFQKYEIFVKFNNGDLINGTFKEKKGALNFLKNM